VPIRGPAQPPLDMASSARGEAQPPLDVAGSAVRRALHGERVRNQRCVLQLAKNHHSAGADEDKLEALISANPIVDPKDGLLGALVVIRDITELNELHRRLAASERDHAIGQMAAGLIHDFNNVLSTLDQAITVMEMRKSATYEQQLSYLAMMHRATRRGSEIIGRLRQYLRSGTGGTEVLDLRELLQDTVELARPMLQGSHTNVHLTAHISPVGMVQGNSSDLRRVFANLILNALQAMPQGGELEVRCERTPASLPAEEHPASSFTGTARTRVVIRDTGSGIPAEAQKKIFRPYFTTKPAGTGLGLSEAQRIVHAMGGRIFFHSEAGKGTRFVVELPLVAESGQRGHGHNGNGRRPAAQVA